MPTILIVEDNDMNRDMLARRLMRRGYDVLVAADGQQGVTVARESRPDLVLMDLGLPVMDGWEATRRIKDDVDINMIPVVALTAHAMAGDEQRAFDAGCDAFDTKPLDLDRLLGTIESLLARRGVA
jgi:two-component system cell cycle response regulator DivK